MKIASVHSHKGGVGKSTFSLFYAKYLAQVKKEKTCLIDLDFQAQGLRSIYLRRYLEYDFFNLIQAEEENKQNIIERIAVKYEDIDELFFIANFFRPQMENHEQNDIKRKMYLKLVNEIYTGEIIHNLNRVIKYLQNQKFENVILDCPPGLVLLSEEVIKEIKTVPVFITTANIISFIGLFQNLLSMMPVWKLTLSHLHIIINRIPEGFELYETLEKFLSSTEITEDEKLVCSNIKKKFFNSKKKYPVIVIRESETIGDMDTLIIPRTLLSLDISPDLKTAAETIYYLV
jgi:cellulose biosynthesis protein BcsQ